MFNVECSHEEVGGTTWPLDLDKERSGRAPTQNENKNNYALTFEKQMYDTKNEHNFDYNL